MKMRVGKACISSKMDQNERGWATKKTTRSYSYISLSLSISISYPIILNCRLDFILGSFIRIEQPNNNGVSIQVRYTQRPSCSAHWRRLRHRLWDLHAVGKAWRLHRHHGPPQGRPRRRRFRTQLPRHPRKLLNTFIFNFCLVFKCLEEIELSSLYLHTVLHV